MTDPEPTGTEPTGTEPTGTEPTDTEHGVIDGGGPSTDTHITGQPEEGTFTTDRVPGAGTPADGSSNAGVNSTGANRVSEERG